MFRNLLIFFLIAIFFALQFSDDFATFQGRCVSRSTPLVPSVSEAHAHNCCCPEKGPCCCDMEEESGPQRPDMAFSATSGGRWDDASKFTASDTGTQVLVLSQNHEAPKIFNGIGPPLTTFYLTNMTFRC